MNSLPRNQVLVGDALLHLRRLPPASVDCVITSPPYFGLRDYRVPHQMGLEENVKLWAERLLLVFDEIERVLKPEGCAWLNLGDSYSRHPNYGAPAKGLLLGPERVLLALTNHGWLVRNKIAWVKPNPTPTSVRDRLTCSWEPMFLLTHAARYYFDLDAIRVAHKTQAVTRPVIRLARAPRASSGPLANGRAWMGPRAPGYVGNPLGKNPGDVWMIGRSGSPVVKHCATFPEGLVETPLLCSCPERVCTACGRAWLREHRQASMDPVLALSWRPACDCASGSRPGVVLDPFMGSGTTAVVAERLHRDWIGIELSTRYAELARRRIASAQARAA